MGQMLEMGFAACEHFLARAPEPRGDRWCKRSLAEHFLCAGRGRDRFVTRSYDPGGLHFVPARCPHVVAHSGEAPSFQLLLAAMEGARSAATRSVEGLSISRTSD